MDVRKAFEPTGSRGKDCTLTYMETLKIENGFRDFAAELDLYMPDGYDKTKVMALLLEAKTTCTGHSVPVQVQSKTKEFKDERKNK